MSKRQITAILSLTVVGILSGWSLAANNGQGAGPGAGAGQLEALQQALQQLPPEAIQQMQQQAQERAQQFIDQLPPEAREQVSQGIEQLQMGMQTAMQQMQVRTQQQTMEQIKAQMNVAEDEWAVIYLFIQKVQAAQKVALAGLTTAPNTGTIALGGLNRTPAAPQAPDNELALALQNLRNSLADPSTPHDAIKARSEAARAARAQADAALTAAENSLRQLLNLRQETILTTAGILR